MFVHGHSSILMRPQGYSHQAGQSDTPAKKAENFSNSSNKTQNASIQMGLTDEQRAEVTELAKRDREVRAHEQAHAAAGGKYAGSPTYDYQRGPNGQLYAVGGEVSIDTSPIPGDPQATLEKAQVIQRAANAPAQPSAADRRVAASAAAMENQARAELAQQNSKNQSDVGQYIDFHA